MTGTALPRLGERFGKTAGVAKLADVFQLDILRQFGGQMAEMAETDEASEHDFFGR